VVGKTYEGKVVRLMDFGAFVTILPGKDGLVHISQISDEHVDKVSDRLNEGDIVRVKVLEIDRQGRVRLSIKEVEKKKRVLLNKLFCYRLHKKGRKALFYVCYFLRLIHRCLVLHGKVRQICQNHRQIIGFFGSKRIDTHTRQIEHLVWHEMPNSTDFTLITITAA